MGFVAWRDGNLVMEEYTEEMLQNAAYQCEADKAWSFANVAVVTAMPKREFEQETRTVIQMVGSEACDPAIAADGSGLLLLSDDMGLRLWSGAVFETAVSCHRDRSLANQRRQDHRGVVSGFAVVSPRDCEEHRYCQHGSSAGAAARSDHVAGCAGRHTACEKSVARGGADLRAACHF